MPVSTEQFRRRITVGIEDSYMLTWIIIVRINFRGKKNGTEINNGGKMSKTSIIAEKLQRKALDADTVSRE